MPAPTRTSLTFLLLLSPLSACTDDVFGEGPEDTDGTSTGGPPTSDPTAEPTTEPTTDPTTDPDTTTTEGTTTDPDSSGTEGPACVDAEDCADLASECTEATCDGGRCVVTNLDPGTPCGDGSDSACDGADTCDGAGTCSANVAGDGAACSDCVGIECACTAGACSECAAFADLNDFTTDRSVLGWELTGDWRLYTEAPSAELGGGKFGGGGGGVIVPAIRFDGQVFGTDGNRSAPYPGGEAETSAARTKPFVLPGTLTFRSWHLYEGGVDFDNKTIRVSIDGGVTWTTLHDCQLGISPGSPMCLSVELRDADAWDDISLAVPAEMVGQPGIVEFGYDTGDGCCDFERGWFIDATGFATECVCGGNTVCEGFGTDCGGGMCAASGACTLDPIGQGTACGSNASTSCGSSDSCDAAGYCRTNDLVNLLSCEDCPAGEDACNGCLDGVCSDCESPTDSFDAGLGAWTVETTTGGGWGLFSQMPGNEDGGPPISPMDLAFMGNDGSFDGIAGGGGETVLASITSPVDTMPDTLVFDSWHLDEGGAADQPEPGVDVKRIEVSTDLGQTWTTLADCGDETLDDFPFCVFVDARGPDEWDTIMLDTSAFSGMDAQVRFTYDTDDGCCGFEYGWFVDDLNFAQLCPDPNPAQGGDDVKE